MPVYGAGQYGSQARVIVAADIPSGGGGTTWPMAMVMAGSATVAADLKSVKTMAVTMAGTSTFTDGLTVRPIVNMAMITQGVAALLPNMRVTPEVWDGSLTAPQSAIEVRVYDRSLNFVGMVTSRTAPSFQVQLAKFGEGVGSFKVSATAAEVLATPGLLDYGNVVVMRDPLTDYHYPWVIEKRTRSFVTTNEVAGDEVSVSGRGALGLMADAVMLSEAWSLDANPKTSSRTTSFASKVSGWYNSSEWGAPAAGLWTAETSARRRNPRGWPDPTAYWIWYGSVTDPATPAGYCYFRTTVNVLVAEHVSMFCSADNAFELWVDGEQVLKGASWKQFGRYDTDLAVGAHTIAIRGYNLPATGGNPAGVLFSMYTSDASSGKLLTKLRHSDAANWLCRAAGTVAPGWDPGDIIRTFWGEGLARGVNTAYKSLVLDWWADKDSSGVTWDSAHKVNRTFSVGTDLLSVCKQLAETSCDLQVVWSQGMPHDKRLRMKIYEHQGVDRTLAANNVSGRPVVLQRALNTVACSYDGDDSGTRTALIIKSDLGWQEEVSATYGAVRREAYLSLGSSEDPAMSTAVATAAFERVGKAAETVQSQAIPVSGLVPFEDFFVGDDVLAYNSAGVLTKTRVVAITLGEDSNGNIAYTPELSSIPQNRMVRATNWLKSMADGTLMGRVSGASPAVIPPTPAPTMANTIDIPFSFSGFLIITTSPYYKFRDDALLLELSCLLQTAGTTDTVLWTRTNGVRDLSFTIPAGVATLQVDLEVSYSAGDNLQVEIATPGAGAAGLTVQAWCS